MKQIKKVAHSDAHSIDVSYLIQLRDFYEKRFINWIKLEGDLLSSIALLECKLKLFKDKNDPRYLENREIVNTLVDINNSVGQFMFQFESLKYKFKDLRMENSGLKQRNQLLEQELITLRKYSNL